MKKFEEFINKHLMPPITKFMNIPFVSGIRNGMVSAMPFLVVGSIGMLIKSLPIPGWENIMSVPFASTTIGNAIGSLSNATFDLFALIAIITVSYNYAKSLQINPVFSTVISIVSYAMVSPLTVTIGEKTISAIPVSALDAKGLFVGFIMVYIAVNIYRICLEKNLIIKMPDSVPPMVSNAFSAMIPIFFALVVSLIMKYTSLLIGFNSFHELVNSIISTPIKSLGGSLPGIMVATFMMTFLWSFGVHGSSIVGGIMNPIGIALLAENLAATAGGMEPINIVTKTFYDMIKLGGAGFTLPLAIMFLFLAKSQQLKQIGKISIVPSLFNVNEPLIFGTPIVLNPVLMIPFWITPLVLSFISYCAMYFGLVPLTTGTVVPWTMPVILHGFLITNSIQGAILQIVLLSVAFLIYYPFFKVYDKQLLTQEVDQQIINEQETEIIANVI